MTDLSKVSTEELLRAAGLAEPDSGGPGLSQTPTADLIKAAGVQPRDISLQGILADMGRMVGKGALQQGHNIATGAVKGAGNLVDVGNMLLNPEAPFAYPPMAPGTAAAEWFFRNVMPAYQPQNIREAALQGAARGAAGAPFGPVVAGLSATGGAVGDVVSHVAPDRPGVAMAAEMVAPLVAGAPFAVRGNASNMLARRTQGMTEADWARAQQFEDAGRQTGFPLLGPESTDNPALHQLAADVAASRTGGPIMGEAFNRRADVRLPDNTVQPGQVRQVMTPLLDAISPSPASTGDVAARTQRAAEGAIQQAEQGRSALVRPFYQAGENAPVNPNDVLAVIADIDRRLAASPPAAVARQLQALRADLIDPSGQPLQTAGQLDNVYKVWRERIELPPTDANNLQKGVAAQLPVDEVGNVATRSSPDLAYGRSLYADLSRDTVGPLRRSEVGQIANRAGIPENTGIESQIGKVISPATARPDVTLFIARTLNQQDRQAFPQLARVYLENALTDATATLRSGPNRTAGAKFANLVAPTQEARINLRAVLRGVAEAHGVPADPLIRGFETALTVMERSGRIPGIGSPTASRAGVAAEASATLVEATNPVGYLRRVWGDIANGRANRQLAEVFTSPNSVEAMRTLAQLGPDNRRSAMIVASLLGWKEPEAQTLGTQ